MRKNSFRVRTAEEHVTILRHSGEHWSMEVESLWFECPVGHRMMLINTTSHRIEQVRCVSALLSQAQSQDFGLGGAGKRHPWSLRWGELIQNFLPQNIMWPPFAQFVVRKFCVNSKQNWASYSYQGGTTQIDTEPQNGQHWARQFKQLTMPMQIDASNIFWFLR